MINNKEMKKTKTYYLENIEQTAHYLIYKYLSEGKYVNFSAEELISNSIYHEMLKQKMDEYNEKTKKRYISLGKTQGNLNKQNGKIGSGLGTKESRSRGAKKSIKIQKESGQLEKFRLKGTKVAAEKKILKNNIIKEKVYNLINLNTFKLKDIEPIANQCNMTKKMLRDYLNNKNIFEFIGFKNKSKVYKKK